MPDVPLFLDPDGAYQHGLVLIAESVGPDYEAALSAFKQAARRGHPAAMTVYARMRDLGLGAPRDPVEGATWWLKAAKAGDVVGLGEWVARAAAGKVTLDEASHRAWARASAQGGDTQGQREFGRLLSRSEALDDRVEGRSWLQQAAAAGDAEAQALLTGATAEDAAEAGANARGRRVAGLGDTAPPDELPRSGPITAERATALGLDLRSALAGEPGAQMAIARAYATGREGLQDPGELVRWYERAAAGGHAEAYAALAALYQAGDHVKPDAARAVAWLRLAEARRGELEPASQAWVPQELAVLEAELTLPERRQADAVLAAWQSRTLG